MTINKHAQSIHDPTSTGNLPTSPLTESRDPAYILDEALVVIVRDYQELEILLKQILSKALVFVYLPYFTLQQGR